MRIKLFGYVTVSVFSGLVGFLEAQNVPTPNQASQLQSPQLAPPVVNGSDAGNNGTVPSPQTPAKPDDITQVSPDASTAFSWRGTPFDIGGSLIAQARFEKFLNEPESAHNEAMQYNAILRNISEILAGKGGEGDQQRIVKAWRLLYQASAFDVDNHISETLGARIVTCWQTNQKVLEVMRQNKDLENDRARYERALRVEDEINAQKGVSGQVTGQPKQNNKNSNTGNDAGNTSQAFVQPSAPPPPSVSATAPAIKRLMEAEATLKANDASTTLSKQTLKLEFQAMILQFFAQRRFQHVKIAADFYSYLFAGEEQTIQGGDKIHISGIDGLDTKLTTTALQTLANEAIRDVESSITVVDYHLGRGELQAATEQLQQAYFLGEFVPVVQTFPREKKQQLTDFVRKADQLKTAIEVKDFDRASTLLDQVSALAADFDAEKPRAVIDGSKQISNLILKRVMVAAQSGDTKSVQDLIQQSVQAWPKNPEINKVTDSLFAKADLKTSLSSDFDRYLTQKDFRAIFNDRFRFGTALANDDARSKQLIDVMKRMEKIEVAIGQAKEFERTSNKYGAWEILEKVYKEFPEDSELNRMRADYALGALDYASALNTADKAVERNDYGSAIAQYLRALDIYPAGVLAQDGLKAAASAYLDTKADKPASAVAAGSK